MSDLTAEELEQGRRSLLSQLRRDLKRDLSEYPVDAATMRDLVTVLEGLAPKPADNGSAVPWSGEHTDTHSFVGGVLAMSTPNAPWHDSEAEPVGVSDEAVAKASEVVGAAAPDLAAYPDRLAYATRAALEAALPFMQPQVVASRPTRDQIAAVWRDHVWISDESRCSCGDGEIELMSHHVADAVLALMGGAE